MEFKIEETIVDTGKAEQEWDARNTGSRGKDEKLYRSDRGRYYVVQTGQGQGSLPSAEFVSNEAASISVLDTDGVWKDKIQTWNMSPPPRRPC
jgi:hypothetical protein